MDAMTGAFVERLEHPAPAADPFRDLSRSLTPRVGLPEQVADALRDMIISEKLKPGERVVESRIARTIGIGQPTVREALKTLEMEGLVVRHPNKGCTVTTLTRKEFENVFRVRIELEALAVELAMELWSAEKTKALAEVMNRFQAAGNASDVAEYSRCDRRFHQSIWRFAENSYLERALVQIVTPVFAFEVVRALQMGIHDLTNGYKSHEQVANAILSGDREYAKHLMRVELRRGQSFANQFLPQRSSP
jgi:DNA-binding GntR family transcriptional regulator